MKLELSPLVASFDVFDTVLTRAIGSPVSSFLLLGNKLKQLKLIDCSAESFARARADAERRAYQNAKGIDSHVTLTHIYAELVPALKISLNEAEEFIKHEKQLEWQLLHVVLRAKELIDEVRAKSIRIAFVSDMYLEGEFIKNLLIEKGLFQQGDKCYVSSDYGKTKHSGKLFLEFLKQESVKANQVMHYGNHPDADVKSAKFIGIQTRSFYEGNLNRYEQILEAGSWASDGLSSAMAGAARIARLTVKAFSTKEKQLKDVAASVAAPLLTGFVLWFLRRAQKLGIKRLYFVSRDGQILHKIATRLIKKLDFECELVYLYGSRLAWVAPGIRNTDKDTLDRLFRLPENFVSIYATFERAFIQPEELQEVLETNGFQQNIWARNLNQSERAKLRQLIHTNQTIHNLIIRRAEEKRTITLKYLQQAGLFEDVKMGMIDVGFSATVHMGLSELLDIAGAKPITSFYVGMRPIKYNYPLGVVETYFFDRRNNTGYDVHIMMMFLEIVCSGDHGTVISYEDKEGKAVPVFTEDINEKVLEWGYEKVRETICCFADVLVLDSKLINPWSDVRESIIKAFKEFWFNPTLEEAQAWGSFLMEEGWGKGAKWVYVAEKFQWQNLSFIIRNSQLKLREHWWSYGSLALTPPPLQTILRAFVSGGKWTSEMKPTVRKKTKQIMLKYVPVRVRYNLQVKRAGGTLK